jgi:hypothetical protein
MSRPEDYDDVYQNSSTPVGSQFPIAAKAAGIIWIAFGILGLINAFLSLPLNVVAVAAAGGGPQGRSNVCGVGWGLVTSVTFLIIGIRTAGGRARGTLISGVASLVCGMPYIGLCVFAFMSARWVAPGQRALAYVIAAMSVLLGAALYAAGTLAFASRRSYANWRVGQGLEQPRLDDDYDPQPGRRGGSNEDDGH